MESHTRTINYFDQSYTIRFATSLAEKEAIYRFRYQNYTQQKHLLENANHDNQTLTDLLDNKNTILIYATDDLQQKVIGTLRINCRKNSNFRFDDLYSRQEFYPYFPIFVSHTSHFLIDQNYPTNKLASEIFKVGYLKLLEKETLFDFRSCERHLVNFYQKLGYRIYKPNYSRRENSSVPMVLCLNDKEYLSQIGSPLLPILQNYVSSLPAECSKKYILTDSEPAELLQRIIDENFSSIQLGYNLLATA